MRFEAPAAPRRQEAYPPDRVAAGIFVAVHAGLMLIWVLAYLQRGDPVYLAQWFSRHAAAVCYFLVWRVNGLWLCLGAYESRRWALIGLLSYGVGSAIQSVYYSFHPYVFVGAAIALYSAVRLTSLVGPKLQRTSSEASFLPDRIYAVALMALNATLVVAFLIHPRPDQPLSPLSLAYYATNLVTLVWYQASLFRSHGWAIGVGAFGSVMGVFSLQAHPDERAAMAASFLGIVYFGLRLAGWGPKPIGLFGARSS